MSFNLLYFINQKCILSTDLWTKLSWKSFWHCSTKNCNKVMTPLSIWHYVGRSFDLRSKSAWSFLAFDYFRLRSIWNHWLENRATLIYLCWVFIIREKIHLLLCTVKIFVTNGKVNCNLGTQSIQWFIIDRMSPSKSRKH